MSVVLLVAWVILTLAAFVVGYRAGVREGRRESSEWT